ncbi:carbamoyltransferase HypF [Jannaschia sp. AI_61]|uniref:carbamoyltransferase HypF n=1 Tax=Jannaschia sp. AI_61 TaxID=2829796 RepID=UPI001C7D57DC|nr:carbamoyltransferase HypF [Jannaschia sp. AI_61]
MRGQVQGVGFRPFVWSLAHDMGLRGTVANDAEGVLIHVAGDALDAFETALSGQAPPLARVDAVESTPADVLAEGFSIIQSGPRGADTRVTPDAATCADCLEEISGSGRRAGYAFTNCTNCGPRLSILRALPYDRANTTMAGFDMCADCAAEYDDPRDRRFHAQPIACPACGPRLWLEPDHDGDPITATATLLRAGAIVAIKGLGGFHLACDATNATALATLRRRKRRPAKPFALMGSLDMIGRYAQVGAAAEARLTDPAAPIVLLPMQGDALPDGVAPGQARLGWMLPATPLHHLLLRAVGRPLLMTSANLSGDPQVTDNDAARRDLAAFADAFLMHDRDIARRLDDGVEAIGPRGPFVMRRARGRVPGTLPLPLDGPQVFAAGGELKAAICLTKGSQALLSHHIGDLGSPLTLADYTRADEDLSDLFDHRPEAIAVDLHPAFQSTRLGRAKADRLGVPVIDVQHHHAHMAAALGEAGWRGEVAVGIVLDGLGLGPDGTMWGGEILMGGYGAVTRAAHLTPAPLIGGDRAQSEPWRNALVRLDAAGEQALADRLFGHHPLHVARRMVGGPQAPLSSSAGRLFDAVAACLGLCGDRQSFEGEAAMALEAVARPAALYVFGWDGQVIDPAPMMRALARDLDAGRDVGEISGAFHAGLADVVARAARQVATQAGTRTVALSGGCFQNVTLLTLVAEALSDLDLCLPGEVPPGDGGLAYGQALVALARLEAG